MHLSVSYAIVSVCMLGAYRELDEAVLANLR